MHHNELNRLPNGDDNFDEGSGELYEDDLFDDDEEEEKEDDAKCAGCGMTKEECVCLEDDDEDES